MKRDKQEGPRSGAFLLASVLHFYSGQPLQNLSGVDTQHRPLSYRRPFLLRLHGPIQMRRGERYSFAEGG
jgi:hypothetical protein